MEEELVAVKDENVTKRKINTKREKQKLFRYGDPDPDLMKFKRPCEHNKKSYECSEVKLLDIQRLRRTFYQDPDKIAQDKKLCHMLYVSPVERHRSNQRIKERNTSLSYFVETENNAKKVCRQFFIAALGISRHRIITVSKFLIEGEVPRERRGGYRRLPKSDKKETLE